MDFLANSQVDYSIHCAARTLNAGFSAECIAATYQMIRNQPHYEVTPLLRMDALSREMGIKAIYLKDERSRFGLNSFKALGGAFTIHRLLQQRNSLWGAVDLNALLLDPNAIRLPDVTIACASAGNHGQAIAAAAQSFHLPCKVFLPQSTSAARIRAVERFGAAVTILTMNYDDTVAAAAKLSAEQGWLFVPDTSIHGDIEAPRLIMLAYMALLKETYDQILSCDGSVPTHIFVQAGVGGLAGSVAAYSVIEWGQRRPLLCVVEPDQADCLMQSAQSGVASKTDRGLSTDMAGLACGKASPLAWEVLANVADFFVTVSDEEVVIAMDRLAIPKNTDPTVATSSSGAAGLAALLCARGNSKRMQELRLNTDSVVLAVITERSTEDYVSTAA